MERTSRPQINPFGLPHITIPAEVLFHPELTPREKMLFGFIWNLTRSAEGMFSCWASNRHLGELLRVKPETITGMVSNLQKHGFIVVEVGQRGDGMVTRDIYINDNYIHDHRQVLVDMAKRLTELKKNRMTPRRPSGTPPMDIGDPPDKSLGQLDRELGKGNNKNLPTEDSGPAGPLDILSKEFLSLVEFWNELPKATKHKVESPPSKTLLRAARYVNNLMLGFPILSSKERMPYKTLLDFVQKHSIDPALIEKQWDFQSIRSMIEAVHAELPKNSKHSLDQVFWNSHAASGGFSWFLFVADRKSADPAALALVKLIYSQKNVSKAPKSKQLNDAKSIAPLLEQYGEELVSKVLNWHLARPDTDEFKHLVRDADEFVRKFQYIQTAMGRAASNGNGSGRCAARSRDPLNTRERNPNLRLPDSYQSREADIHVTQNF